jgi:uncharacterized repeat protein (TIGR03803 family)
MRKSSLVMMACAVFVSCALTAALSSAQTFTSLASFNGTDGEFSTSQLVQGTDGNFYGTTTAGGANNSGTVFKLTSAGELTAFYSFCSLPNCADGAGPSAGLILATDGNFYGTTSGGGAHSDGAVYKITLGGKLTTLYSFCSVTNCADGTDPFGGLVEATNGEFYGTTGSGGKSNYGTVFKITSSGKLTTLYSFCSLSNCADGANPYPALIQGTDGNLYGEAEFGGRNTECPSGCGTMFKITPAGKLTTLYNFCSLNECGDGYYPFGGLVQATNGDFYGVTYYGGSGGEFDKYGTVFKITSAGKLTRLYSFCTLKGCADGTNPYGGLIQGTDDNFYGAASEYGANAANCTEESCGTIFEITPTGKYTVLYNFCSQGGTECTDGMYPSATLVQGTDGTFYGTTYLGGANDTCDFGEGYPGCGTVFSISTGLGPFVETVPTSAEVAAKVIILGSSLTGSTAVSFNGTAAAFTVVSATEITTTVPAGATTGTLQVTTPGGTLNSNLPFRVIPQILSFNPQSGPVGTPVTITGVSLTQTSKVTFGGVAATSFTVNSDTQVTADVPTGAVTGKIEVTTPGGTATSSDVFTVTE